MTISTTEMTPAARRRNRVLDSVARWRREVPLYRDRTAPAGAPTEGTWGREPFLTKAEMREGFPGNFLRDGVELAGLMDRDEVELEHTSGTSGPRTPLLLGQGWWSVQEARALSLNRIVRRRLQESEAPRRVVLAAPGCTQTVCYQQHPTAGERAEGGSLPVSLNRFPWLADAEEWERVAGEIDAWRPMFLDVDPIYGAAFARHCLATGRRFPSVQFVVSSYEFAGAVHRRRMSEAWGVPLFDLYGSTETGHLLMEDEGGRMRSSEETAWLEVVDAGADGVGELVVTTLTNEYMPLIRYRIGDLVEKRGTAQGTDYVLHGRAVDALRDARGGRVTVRQADECISPWAPLWHYHLAQDPSGRLRLRYIADRELSSAERNALGGRFAAAFGPLPWSAVRVDALIGETSGKFRLTQPVSAAV